MPACSCMCLGKAESTGARAPAGETAAESDVERTGCLRIETGAAPAGRVTEGEGEGTGTGTIEVVDRDDDAAEDGLDTEAGAEAIRGGPCALYECLRVGDVDLGNLGD
jgi:hypothetical protein